VERLPSRQEWIELDDLREVASVRACLLRFANDVDTADHRFALIGSEKAQEYVERRRLPGAVRAEQAHDLPGRDGEIEAIERGHPVVPLDQPAGAHDLAFVRHEHVIP
jgi:hypothetical protein